MNTKNKLHPALKVELLTKNKFLKNARVIDFLKRKGLQCLKDQDYKENILPFSYILQNITLKKYFTPNFPWEISYRFKESQGTVKIHLHNKFDPEKPSIIYHHGIGEIYHPAQIHFVFNQSFLENFNVFSIKASHHESVGEVINSYINNLTNFNSGIAGSYYAFDEVIRLHHEMSQKPVIACGVSLGGIIASLHYYLEGSADLYFPIISHPDLSKIILDPTHKSVIRNQELLKKNASLKTCYKIPSNLMSRPKVKIFPILGRLDLTVNFEDAQKLWSGYQVLTLDTGHSSIFFRRNEIQSYILSKIPDLK